MRTDTNQRKDKAFFKHQVVINTYQHGGLWDSRWLIGSFHSSNSPDIVREAVRLLAFSWA
jgi:hypothetical protein